MQRQPCRAPPLQRPRRPTPPQRTAAPAPRSLALLSHCACPPPARARGWREGALPRGPVCAGNAGAGADAEGQGGTGSLPLGAQSEEALGSSPSGTAVDSEWHGSPAPARSPPQESPLQAGQGAGGGGARGGAEWHARTRASGATPFESAEGMCDAAAHAAAPGSAHGAPEPLPLQAPAYEGPPGVARPTSGMPPSHSSPLSLPRSGPGSARPSTQSPLMPAQLHAVTSTSRLAGTPECGRAPAAAPHAAANEQCGGRKRGSPPLPPAAASRQLLALPGPGTPAPSTPTPTLRHTPGSVWKCSQPQPRVCPLHRCCHVPSACPNSHRLGILAVCSSADSGDRLVQQNLSSAFSSTASWPTAALLGGPSPTPLRGLGPGPRGPC